MNKYRQLLWILSFAFLFRAAPVSSRIDRKQLWVPCSRSNTGEISIWVYAFPECLLQGYHHGGSPPGCVPALQLHIGPLWIDDLGLSKALRPGRLVLRVLPEPGALDPARDPEWAGRANFGWAPLPGGPWVVVRRLPLILHLQIQWAWRLRPESGEQLLPYKGPVPLFPPVTTPPSLTCARRFGATPSRRALSTATGGGTSRSGWACQWG